MIPAITRVAITSIREKPFWLFIDGSAFIEPILFRV
jgi:hypothetical protein